jgi:hypothetical protein
VQAADPVIEAKVPSAHCEHGPACPPTGWKVPAEHREQDEEPSTPATLPAPHWIGSLMPMSPQLWPNGHKAQTEAPWEAAKEPTGQTSHPSAAIAT